MSEDTNLETTVPEGTPTEVTQTPASADQLQSLNEKLYAEVKSLRAENKDRRLKNEAFEMAEKEKTDANLGWQEKHNKVTAELEALKVANVRDALGNKFTSQMIDEGLDSKLAKLTIPTDLSDDNMDSKIKETKKEYANYLRPKGDTKPTTPSSPFAQAQPTTKAVEQPKQSMGDLARSVTRGGK